MDLNHKSKLSPVDKGRKRPWRSVFSANAETLRVIYPSHLQEVELDTSDGVDLIRDRTVGGDSVLNISIMNLDKRLDTVNETTDEDKQLTYLLPLNELPSSHHHSTAEDDEIKVIHSNAINPLIVYPHLRSLCGVYPFQIDDCEKNQLHCPKCFCYVCDRKALICKNWGGTQGHCNAYENQLWLQKKLEKTKNCENDIISLDEDSVDNDRRSDWDSGLVVGERPCGNNHEIIMIDDDDEILHTESRLVIIDQSEAKDKANFDSRGIIHDQTLFQTDDELYATQNTKNRKFMRINEILTSNIRAFSAQRHNQTQKRNLKQPASDIGTNNMEGDLPHLNLQAGFYIEGIKIGWPYPKIMLPQRQIALHLIKAFKNSKHVAIESPTGTGKSAAILCSALAWQRYNTLSCHSNNRIEEGKILSDDSDISAFELTPKRNVKIFYCSRTHTQVKQMIATLQSTPYRPRMAILGSRDKLCINEKIRPRDGSRKTSQSRNINQECRLRVAKSEQYRKHCLNSLSLSQIYDDNDPLSSVPDDSKTESVDPNEQDFTSAGNSNEPDTNQSNYMCPHYQCLTIPDVARLVSDAFIPSKNSNSASVRGKEGKMGIHDIEDLISFGLDPIGDSKISACPYYLSQSLARDADLIFAPYNYLLDGKIRKAQGIDIDGAIVVCDEAHNIEDVLKSAGSGEFQEIELLGMIIFLSKIYTMSKSDNNNKKWPINEGEPSQSDVSHSLLLFVERIVLFLLEKKNQFLSNRSGTIIHDYLKYKWSEDHVIDFLNYSPTGTGNEPTGAKSFFEQLFDRFVDVDKVMNDLEVFEKNAKTGIMESLPLSTGTSIFERLIELVNLICQAAKMAEHFYVVAGVRANGSVRYAINSGDYIENPSNMGTHPAARPSLYSRTDTNRDIPPHECNHEGCISAFHGACCDGSKPPWLFTLKVSLLHPGIIFREVASKARSIVLASGSLSPIMSLCAELDLVPPQSLNNVEISLSPLVENHNQYRLQLTPKPLEANHIIDMGKQLLAFSVGSFPDGSPLTVKRDSYSHVSFVMKLGNALLNIVNAVPIGGTLVFFPSYSLLKKCVDAWGGNTDNNYQWQAPSSSDRDKSIWRSMIQSKGTVIVEPTGSQSAFEEAREQYNQSILCTGSAVLLAVFRGKMSEGISFNDNFCRAVILVGIPFPNSADLSVEAKKKYNNEQRRFRKRTELLEGQRWYELQAYRAVAQALGRCIRHAGDFGAIILLDSRYCDDGSPRDNDGVAYAHKNLPKWIRNSIVSFQSIGQWRGLGDTFKAFFESNR